MATGFKKATVKSSRVPSTQSNFPVYVDLKRLNGGTSMTSAEANSIRVYANESKTTEWAREIVSVDEMHVKVPSMTSTTDIYVDWDGSRSDYGVTDTYGRNAVWSGYLAVYHLESLTSDSTGNYNLTNNNTVGSATTKIGKGADGTSSNGNKKLSTTNTMGITNGNVSISAWFRTYSLLASNDERRTVAWHSNNTNVVSNHISIFRTGGSTYAAFNRGRHCVADYQVLSEDPISINTWYYGVHTYDGTNGRGYLNGALEGTRASSGNGSCSGFYLDGFCILGNTRNQEYLNGLADEVRITSSVLSADWITTEYNNQNDEADFWGAWADAGGSPAVAKGGILLAW
jgi:hypothetical protein